MTIVPVVGSGAVVQIVGLSFLDGPPGQASQVMMALMDLDQYAGVHMVPLPFPFVIHDQVGVSTLSLVAEAVGHLEV